ncbi:hypothetical protein CIPAW_11G032600 [Carya illinoinensis]|uniref:Uncharacterized protein n=1 Tax=Carya illinoinensis TaxID=32201 RepID=A0A8T1P333_CARIL|nr:hypothetical protein CIPAW_11G032600 [Carya illinoinensis]
MVTGFDNLRGLLCSSFLVLSHVLAAGSLPLHVTAPNFSGSAVPSNFVSLSIK